VHHPVAADNADDASDAGVATGVFQLDEIFLGTTRRGVAAIKESVDVDLGDASLGGILDQRMDVRLVAVHATVGNQAQHVQGLAGGSGQFDRLGKFRVLADLAIGDIDVDAADVLQQHTAG